jgi:hypothetical protein
MTVVDLEGMKLLDWRLMLPHLQEFIDLLKHYPSVNHDTVIINLPNAFQGRWKWIHTWINAVLSSAL